MSRRDELRRRAAMKLQESEVLMRQGHFDSGNGFHGRVYLNPHQLFRYPSTIWQLAQDLLDILPGHLLDRTEVVAGPATGGALLAHTLAGLLDGRRALTHPPCSFAPFTISGDGFVLRDFYAREMAGRRVLLADDVRNTGKIRRRRTIRSRTARCAWRASRLRPSEQEAVRGASRGGDGGNGTSFNT